MKKTLLAAGLVVMASLTGCGTPLPTDKVLYDTMVDGNGTIEYSDPGEVLSIDGTTWLTYDYGTKVTMTAKPAKGYYFDGWYTVEAGVEFLSDEPTITVTMDRSPYLITAWFFQIPVSYED